MPVNIPLQLPAIDLLKKEQIFVMDPSRATTQDIRPLKIAVLNLMPLKITTETDIVRLLSNTPLQVELSFMKLQSHTSVHTSVAHMEAFYSTFQEMRDAKYDGLIITGAPVELLPFEAVSYWSELQEIFDWSLTHVTSTLHICWAAQAALYHHYGLAKQTLPTKCFGVYAHDKKDPYAPIFRGFDDQFFVPHSRHTEVASSAIVQHPALELLSESPEAGAYMVMANEGRQFFVMGHAEYAPGTLDAEYQRDVAKDLATPIPCHYYPQDDPTLAPMVTWRAHAHLFYSNWLNYYVYQATPYNINEIQ